MSNYRPITDLWFLARAKLKGGRKYYGAYLGGFPERARVLRHYPYPRGFGQHDKTLDIDPATEPDFVHDARSPWPLRSETPSQSLWKAVLVDPPYSEADAAKYAAGVPAYPSPNLLVVNALEVIAPGSRVGIIHYSLPACPKNAKFVAAVGVLCGFNNRIRCYSVFEKL